jgi:uncharacterized protein (TIGR02266 family)
MGAARGFALMIDHDAELARLEAEVGQEEQSLNAELTRLVAASTDYERRLKQLKAQVAEAELLGAKDGHLSERAKSLSVPSLEVEAVVRDARDMRSKALAARQLANQEVRSKIAQFRSSVQQLAHTLSNDERQATRLWAHAKQEQARHEEAKKEEAKNEEATRSRLEARDAPKGDDAILGDTLISAVPGKTARKTVKTLVPPVPPPAVAIGSLKPMPKRHSPRVKMQAQVDFESDNNFFNGFSANISDGGIFIATVNLLPLGTQVDLGFTLPTGERVECKGSVRWVRDVDDNNPHVFPGMGVQFVDLEASAARTIERFIQQRDPMFYVE